MKPFKQMLSYLWPQWPRIVVVVFCALVIAVLLAMSFMTIIPLLKVLMGEEGLHGWVDRKTVESVYGLQFYSPTAVELTEDREPSRKTHLEVVRVAENSLAARAGIRQRDFIADVNNLQTRDNSNALYTQLLHELATARGDAIPLRLWRPQNDSPTLDLATPENESYVQKLDWSPMKRFRWEAETTAARVGQQIVRFLPVNDKVKSILIIMGAITVVTLIRCIAKFYQDYLGQKIVETGINKMRENVFGHMTRMPIGYFAEERPSDLISRIVRDTVTMGGAMRVLLGKALREPMNALIMLITALFLNWQLSLVFLCGAPFVALLLGSFGRKMKKATRHSLIASSQMLSKLQETVTGLRVVKIYNQQEYELNRFRSINDRLLKQLLKISKVDAATHPVLEVLGMVAGTGALVVGMVWVSKGQLDGPEFLLLLVLLGAAAEAIRKTSDLYTKIQQANAAAERVFGVLEQPLEPEKPDAIPLPPARGDIEFQNVVFTYPGSPHPTLHGINLTITAGQNVAIVGANGSGKTTLANLLPRFYDPDSGRVLVDGRDIRDVTIRSLRDQIGMVTQQAISFNDTIASNIAYGKSGATQDEIVAAAKRAYAHEFITRLPNGYDTVIGEQGVGLSGGQLQRIVIARAIVKNPAVLIFDEATSQIDAESEAKIHDAIKEIMRGRTTLMIAHRFSTVVAADMIVVMNDGRIIAKGQHEELIRTCPAYQALYETQLVKA
ncbi:MAG TPA: ABC transporter transmembrane domain-containing protein [Sedimentisphaerales bacterium]|nr:ABC transporter transmembrane domain-containing protein [Sedimentisphaerales bacterium]